MNRPIAAILTATTLVMLPPHVLDAQQPEGEPFAADGILAVPAPRPAGRLPDR